MRCIWDVEGAPPLRYANSRCVCLSRSAVESVAARAAQYAAMRAAWPALVEKAVDTLGRRIRQHLEYLMGQIGRPAATVRDDNRPRSSLAGDSADVR